VVEAHARLAVIDARANRVQARLRHLRLGVGQLDAGRPALQEELAADAVRFLRRLQAARGRGERGLGSAQRAIRVLDLVADRVLQRVALRFDLRRPGALLARRRLRVEDVVEREGELQPRGQVVSN